MIESLYNGEVERSKPLIQYKESLKKIINIDPTIVYPGHGPTVNNTIKLIQKRFYEMEKRASEITNILKEGHQTCFEICRKLFPNKYDKQIVLTISETLGHLDLLESRNEVNKTIVDGVSIYSLSS